MISARFLSGLRLALAGTALAGALVAFAPAAQAQNVLAIVNNRAITSLDVAQRIRIAAMTERRRLGAREALEELVDDEVKIIEAGRVGYRVTEEGVENDFVKLAKANSQSTRDFEDTLRRAGLEPNAVRTRIRANIAWNALLRDRTKLGTNVTRAEVDNAAGERRRTAAKVVEYTLVPVVFIVPPGTSPAARAGAANAARAKFRGCEAGFETLRAMPDVFVRPSIVRNSDDLSAQLRGVLEKTPVGQMTAPSAGEQGVESIAVCGKRDISRSESTDIASIAEELSQKRMNATNKEYLAELRKKVTIQYRRR